MAALWVPLTRESYVFPQAKLKSFSTKIVQLLKEWTEAFPYDFQDEKAMAELKAIAHRVTQCDEVRSSLGPLPGFLGIFGGGETVSTGISSYVVPFPVTSKRVIPTDIAEQASNGLDGPTLS